MADHAMRHYFLLMHDDATGPTQGWDEYLGRLRAAGVFEGGSSIGGGMVARKVGRPAPLAAHLGGFIRITARDLDHAQEFLDGNPVYEAGGTVEIRELPRTE
jgi:hypothetical protein